VFHQPAYSCARHDSTPAVIENWVPLFEASGVDVVLNGHDHNYQRLLRHGVTYVVTGGAGTGLYAVDACQAGDPPLVASEDDVHTFVTVEGTRDRLRLRAVDQYGDIVDTVTLQAD
jgi:hypothetical protein